MEKKKIRKKLNREWYELLRNMDYSLMDVNVSFDDENCIFESSDEFFDVIFDMNIVAYGMDSNQDQCNEYGRKLYMLYDLIYFSDYGNLLEADNGER